MKAGIDSSCARTSAQAEASKLLVELVLLCLLAAVTLTRRLSIAEVDLAYRVNAPIRDVSGQPLCAGHPLSYWLSADCDDPVAQQVLSELDSNAVPVLIQYWTQATSKADIPTQLALLALMRMGPRASPAVSTLTSALTNESHIAVSQAVLVLGAIGPKASPAVHNLLMVSRGNSGKLRGRVIETLGYIGPAASNAIPFLTEVIASDDDYNRARAAWAIWRIGALRDVVVPVLQELRQSELSMFAEALLEDIEADTQPELTLHHSHEIGDSTGTAGTLQSVLTRLPPE